MKKYNMSIYSIIGISFYLVVFIIDKFVYEMSDWLYTCLILAALIVMLIGIYKRRKGK
jgi:hypothetical protein